MSERYCPKCDNILNYQFDHNDEEEYLECEECGYSIKLKDWKEIPYWNGLIEHAILKCIHCNLQCELGAFHHSCRIPVTTTNEKGDEIKKPGYYILTCPNCKKENIIGDIPLITKEDAERDYSKINWMDTLLKLKEFPIKWDRLTKKEDEISLFGWIYRKDEKARDFVFIEFVQNLPVSVHTSSAKYSKKIYDALEFENHQDCIPFDQGSYNKLLVGDPK